jgi:hypothetical protein
MLQRVSNVNGPGSSEGRRRTIARLVMKGNDQTEALRVSYL